MNEVQEGLLKLILEIDDICNRNGVIYYLGGGTALGAVRHNGFLPWDDDADLYITRDNWEKLLSVIDNELAPNRDLVCIERTPNYLNPIARYMDLDTTWVYQSQMFAGTPLGQHVEFLILDPMPAGEEAERDYIRLFSIYAELLTPWFVVNRRVAESGNVFFIDDYHRYKSEYDIKGEEVLKDLEEKLYCYNEGEGERYHLRHGVEIHSYTQAYFGMPKRVCFEGHLLPVAGMAEHVLREAYGDSWKKIPPVEEQVIHKSSHELSKPYRDFQHDYFQAIDIEKARDVNIEWKYKNVECLPSKSAYDYEIDRVRNAFDLAALEVSAGSSMAFSHDDYNRVYTVLKTASRFGVKTLALESGVLSSSIEYFLRNGEYWKANVVLSNSADGILSEELRTRYEIAVEASRSIDFLLDVNEIDAAIALTKGVPAEIECLTPLPMHARVARIGNGPECEAELSEARELFPDYSFFALRQAILLEEHDVEIAVEMYADLCETSLDGLVVLEARKRIGALGAGLYA